jgi:hypothetical protein
MDVGLGGHVVNVDACSPINDKTFGAEASLRNIAILTEGTGWREEFHGNSSKISIKSPSRNIQGGTNMTGTDLCVNKPHCTAAVRP